MMGGVVCTIRSADESFHIPPHPSQYSQQSKRAKDNSGRSRRVTAKEEEQEQEQAAAEEQEEEEHEDEMDVEPTQESEPEPAAPASSTRSGRGKRKLAEVASAKADAAEEEEEAAAEAGEGKGSSSSKQGTSKLVPAQMKVVDLRRELRARGLPSSGLKAQLVSKLEEALALEELAGEEEAELPGIAEEDEVGGWVST